MASGTTHRNINTNNRSLNLTAASHVFVFEPAWNPAIEQQAIDRVHRLGQTSDVEVIRYIAKGIFFFQLCH